MYREMQLGRREGSFLLGHLILFFVIPSLPRSVLVLTDLLLIRLALLAGLIAAAYVSPLVAIATFLVIALLFVERNRIKIKRMEEVMNQSTMDSPAIQSIETPETAPAQPTFNVPVVESHPFMPQDDSGDNSFAPVAESMNAKKPLPTESSNQGSQKAIQQLFGWVNADAVQETTT